MTLSHEELVSEIHQLELSHEMITEELLDRKKAITRVIEFIEFWEETGIDKWTSKHFLDKIKDELQ